MKGVRGLCLLAVAFAMPVHAESGTADDGSVMLIVEPTVLDADWENGKWSSGYAEFSQARANFQMKSSSSTEPEPLSEDYGDRRRYLGFEVTDKVSRSGDYSVKFYSKPRYREGIQPYRTEIAYFGSLKFDVGDEWYYAASYRPDANWTKGARSWTTVITQWKIAGGGRPAFSLGLSNDGWHRVSLARNYHGASDVETDYTPLGTLPVDEWTDFVFYFKWSTNADRGIARVWKNGELMHEYFGITWYQNHLTEGYLQLGMYTQIESEARTLYIDNVRIGDSVTINRLPDFVKDPIRTVKVEVDAAYAGSVAGSATDPEESRLTYSKAAGPEWLHVAADGELSGTPGSEELGLNVFTIRVTDEYGEDTATLNINVVSVDLSPAASDDFERNT